MNNVNLYIVLKSACKWTGALVRINGKMNEAMYCDILDKNLIPLVRELNMKKWLGLPA